MSKARDIADLGSNDVLDTSSSGIDVTGSVSADGATFDGYVTVNDSVDLNGTLYPNSVFMADSQAIVFGSDADAELSWAGSYLNLNTKGNDIRIMDGLDTKVIWDASNERLGIGTSSPSRQLSVYNSTGDANLTLRTGQSGTGNSQLMFGDAEADNTGRITYAHTDNHMRFQTNGTEAMRIDSSGRVGIGTSSPSSFFSGASQLVVGSGSGAQGITIYSASNDNAQIFFADGTTGDEAYRGILRYRHDNDAMTFHTAGATERMRIDSSGNVGIGTNIPSTKLDVNGSIYANNYTFNISKITAATVGYPSNSSIEVRSSSASSPSLIFRAGSSTERMRIDSAGRVRMPYQPAFIATDGSGSIPHSTVVICTYADLNIGGHYSTTTGRFTAPVSGTYRFSITGLYTINNGSATFKGIWRKNGSQVGVAYEYQTSNLNGSFNTIGTSTVLVYLSAGDYVDLLNGDTTSHGTMHISGSQTKLCGEFIG